ncbi:MAG: imidazolonepropionase, partial [Alphaproteobacteria bacterium]|nr:imidazolonepropionase [Alphaproteobacteria bacterium]
MKIILKDCREILTLKGAHQKDGRFLKPKEKSILKNKSILCENGLIKEIDDFVTISKIQPDAQIIECKKLCVTPELIDSHTHLVFGGNRAFEYTMRLDGASYEDIAKKGGGILHTMEQTNSSTRDELFNVACAR